MEYKYLIGTRFIYEESIEITKQKYDQIKKNKEKLLEALYIEEKFDFILKNYEEYESELLTIALKAALYDNYKWDNLVNDIHIMGRRVTNLLSVCRLYFDQTSNSLSKLYGKKSDEYQLFQESRHCEYDSNLAYRVMEELRNYIQHNNLPIHKLLYSRRNKDNKLLNSTAIYMEVDKLKSDNKIKKQVLLELETKDDYVDIRPYTKRYISLIAKIHYKLNEKLKNDLENCEKAYRDTIQKYNDRFPHNSGDIKIMEIKNNGKVKDNLSISILKDIIERRKRLVEKNKGIESIDKIIISNE